MRQLSIILFFLLTYGMFFYKMTAYDLIFVAFGSGWLSETIFH